MSNIKSLIPFKILQTGDGSPTLSIDGGEKMHSMGGAFSESLYIYGEALKRAINHTSDIRVLSMGLGLSYNEWITIAMALKYNLTEISIHSFESQTFLNQALINYFLGKKSDLNPSYQEILKLISTQFSISTEEIFLLGQKLYLNKKWVLNNSLGNKNLSKFSFNVIFYDAFSSETDRSLWTEEHFANFLHEFCDEKFCIFSTYAATGKLKRSLNKSGFLVEKKAGFGKKRESTTAIRQT